jgi:hypothetical protein
MSDEENEVDVYEDEESDDGADWTDHVKTAGALLFQGMLVGFGTAAGHSLYKKFSDSGDEEL